MQKLARPVRIAVVLAGAGAKGAFEAGALHVLVRENVQIVRIVATSAGALNGVLLAAAVRAQELEAGTDKIVDLWRDHAGWIDVLHPKLRLLRKLQGFSDNAKVLKMLRAQVPPQPLGEEINLRLLVAPLGGITRTIGDRPATSYEALADFVGVDFATPKALEKMFVAASASAAFPLVFAPVEIEGLGPCVDGGAVNNTPIAQALEGPIGDDIDAVVVISTTVEFRDGASPELRGTALASHLGSMLIDERLFRDLREVEATNLSLERLAGLVESAVIDPSQLEQVLDALGWARRRIVDVIQIRPVEDLPGTVFSGLFDSALRAQYLEVGSQRAREVLGSGLPVSRARRIAS